MRLKGPFAKYYNFSSEIQKLTGDLISSPNPNFEHGYVRLHVPYVHQRHVNLCGDAATQMLLAYHKRPFNNVLVNNPRGVFQGFETSDIRSTLNKHELAFTSIKTPNIGRWNCGILANTIRASGPIICRLDYGRIEHYILLFGVHSPFVIFHDPWEGANKTMTIHEFNAGLAKDMDDPTMIAAKPFADFV